MISQCHILSVLALVLAVPLAGCKLFGGGGSGSEDDADDVVVVTEPTPIAQATTSPLAVRLAVTVLDGEGEAATTYAQHTKPLFDAYCISCHGTGSVLDFADFPFKSRFASPAKLMAEVLKRAESPTNPMPPLPSPALDATAIKLLKDWQRDGLVKSHVPPSAKALRKYKVHLAWSVGGKALGKLTLPWRDDGIYDGPLGDLAIGSNVELVVHLLDAAGKKVGERKFTIPVSAPAPEPKRQPLPLAMDWQPPPAPPVKPPPPPADTVAPVIPEGAVQITDKTNVGLQLTWPAASDDHTSATGLRYLVYTANGPLTTLELALENGYLAAGPLIGATGVALTGMTPGKLYDLAVVVKDQTGNASMYPYRRTTMLATKSPNTIVSHGQDCAARLGALKPWSCLDGEIVPVTINGTAVPLSITPQQAGVNYEYDNTTNPQTCDRPALLGLGRQGQCVPYTRVGRLKSYREDGSVHPDVDTVYTCRRYYARFGTGAGTGPEDHRFEDVAVIQHNRVTGETCFFQALEEPNAAGDRPSIDGRRVPPPHEAALPAGAPAYAESAPNFWRSPQSSAAIKCITCHDSDPWMHSPYIDQVLGTDGKHLVPDASKTGTWTGHYSVIGNRGFDDWPTTYAIESTVTTDTNGLSCTSCHNIGSEKTCKDWRRYATGVAARGTGTTGRTFPYAYWMPPAVAGAPLYADLHAWEDSGFQRAAERLGDCCDDPESAGCRKTKITTLPPPYALP